MNVEFQSYSFDPKKLYCLKLSFLLQIRYNSLECFFRSTQDQKIFQVKTNFTLSFFLILVNLQSCIRFDQPDRTHLSKGILVVIQQLVSIQQKAYRSSCLVLICKSSGLFHFDYFVVINLFAPYTLMFLRAVQNFGQYFFKCVFCLFVCFISNRKKVEERRMNESYKFQGSVWIVLRRQKSMSAILDLCSRILVLDWGHVVVFFLKIID